MKKSNVISILETFTDEEINLFEDFLNSPFHNKNTKAIDFFKLLKKYHPDYASEKIKKENLFKELFGSLKFKESYIRNLFSDLNILTEKFLQHKHITQNYANEKFLIEELNSRDLYDLMEKKIRLLEKKIDSEKSKNQDYFLNKIFIYEMKSFLRVDKTLMENFRPDEILSVIKLSMIALMETSFYLIVEEQRVRIKHDFEFLKLALGYLKKHLTEFEDSPLLMIYYQLWLCFFDKNNEEHFLKVKELFQVHFDSLKQIEKRNIYSLLQTYCLNKIDSGNFSYNKELLNILLEMLKLNVVSHKGKNSINLNLYRNILVLCSSLKEINILKKFISDYINFISSESRSSMLAYSYAYLSFLEGNFEKTLEMCNKINFNDFLISTNENLFFKNDIKGLILKCLYELNSFENAISLIDTYRHFLKKSRLIKEKLKNKYINFINFVNELIRIKINFDDVRLNYLKNRVLNTKDLVNSGWILEKVDELEKNNFNKQSYRNQ